MHIQEREGCRTKAQQTCAEPQQSGPCGSRPVTVVSVVEGFGRKMGSENRTLYGEMMQTLIPLTLRKDYFGAF